MRYLAAAIDRRHRWTVYCIYEPTNGRTHLVRAGHGADDEIISEAEALEIYGGDWVAERVVAGIRQVQVPAVVNIARTRFTVLTAEEAPILIEGEPYVPVAS